MEYHPGEEALEKALVEKQFSPYVGRSYPTRVLFGDQHLHTEMYGLIPQLLSGDPTILATETGKRLFERRGPW